ncbi:abc transporter atp-binding protein : ABC-type transport system, ATPase component OS=Candidatus Nitrospira defluvii GN=NIDE4018 PE=3 SV=1: ABC_tran: ABC_tran [Gemmata massiliana]|uniref:ABC transporter domain-containing protein n=1 Tax=Gemmata massiliana TaxID=1210884 RepID=A0A6P2D363_9BACT|nr:ABC-F family ATP-binding cassette domain-containing protein [Gemmata massiliana]VTR95317.1 abc transporter atp-binding protein : ABC-type transport system, ATPase component OS=Candidatus Nitrospira defluvii GN=NIDE4018 PE=3 SV=1: ABC_tran: ABC_tran [Gemmata massiliana]
MSLLLSAQELSKSYGPRPLFEGLSVELRAGERVGLIGPNGAGKSTLLKILAGIEVPDSGTRTARRGVRVGYLTQDDVFEPGQSAQDVLMTALVGENLEDHERETRTAITLTQVGFEDFDVRADTLSGGWRKRLSIARELVREPDLLLMDEPTNHLDLPGVVWLERLLRAAPFAYLVATHDRAFLRAVSDEILEVSRVYPGGAFRVAGAFDDFADKRDAFLEAQARQRDAVANQVRRETEWLGRKESAQRKKSRSRIGEAAARRDELAELNYRTAAAGTAAIDFAGTGRQTKKLLTATGIGKALGGRPLFSGLDLIVSPGTRLGLLGPNGSGKSTLLKALAGEIESDQGVVTRADGLRVVTFEQGRSTLDLTVPLRTALSPNSDTVTFNGRQLHVGGWAQRFLFRPDQLDVEMSALSGGERARVRIAQLMLKPADLLLLDEPTNDLDIPSLEALEDSLDEFPGAVILVTHDRDLMDRLCTEVIGLDGLGGSAKYGSVGQWLTSFERATEAAKPAPVAPVKKAPTPPAAKPKKLSFKEQQEWDGIEAAIVTAEEAVATREQEVANAGSNHVALTAACKALEEAQAVVEKLYTRWQELEAKRGGS